MHPSCCTSITGTLSLGNSNSLASWTTTVDQVPDAEDGTAADGKFFGRLMAVKP